MDEPEAGLLEAGPTFFVDGAEFDPARHGYTAVHNYANYFWRPYLGNTAFSLWELLLSFCYGDKDIVFPSIARLARMLTNSDHSRTIVTGRARPSRLKTCEVLETSPVSSVSRCEGAPGPRPKTCEVSETSQVSQVSRCEGALDVLRRERLVQVSRDGDGRLSTYTFRLCKVLPILRPDQVARLSPALQHDHAIWLRRRGIDQRTYQQGFAPPAESVRTTLREDAVAMATHPAPACAPDTSPSAPATEGAAPRTRPYVPHTTNHPQEELPWKHWWQDALKELRPQLLRGTFEICLLRTRVQSFRDGVLTLHAASLPVRDALQHRLLPLLRRTLDSTSHGEVRQIVVE